MYCKVRMCRILINQKKNVLKHRTMGMKQMSNIAPVVILLDIDSIDRISELPKKRGLET